MPHIPSPRRFRLSGLALSLLLATPVFAHDAMPANWCLAPDTSPVIVATFDFTPTTLASYRAGRLAQGASNEDPDCDRSGSRSCGIVDDWHWANEMSLAFCGEQGGQPLASAPLRVSGHDAAAAGSAAPAVSALAAPSPLAVPFVSSPAIFNVSDHHRLYRFSTGDLVGVCVVCKPNVAQPAPTPVDPSAPTDR